MKIGLKLFGFTSLVFVFLTASSLAAGCMGSGMMCMGGDDHSSSQAAGSGHDHSGASTSAGDHDHSASPAQESETQSDHAGHGQSTLLAAEGHGAHGATSEQHAGHSVPQSASEQSHENQPAAQLDHKVLNDLLDHYVGIWDTLSKDSLDGIREHAVAIQAASEKMIQSLTPNPTSSDTATSQQALKQISEDAKTLGQADKIASARDALGRLSDSLIKLLEGAALKDSPDQKEGKKIFVFHCDMVQKDWLQVQEQLANPYMGSSMLKCGRLVKTMRV